MNNQLGRNTVEPGRKSVKISKKLHVDKPRKEVYKMWRKLGTLPDVFSHVKEVKGINGKKIHWVVTNPADQTDIAWNAELKDDLVNERVTWQSVKGSDVDVKGEVSFFDSIDGNGTDVEIMIRYTEPEGEHDDNVSDLFTRSSKKSLSKD